MRFVLYTTLLWKHILYFLEITQPNSSMIMFMLGTGFNYSISGSPAFVSFLRLINYNY